jgi:hypothetical protein
VVAVIAIAAGQLQVLATMTTAVVALLVAVGLHRLLDQAHHQVQVGMQRIARVVQTSTLIMEAPS